MNNLRLLLVEDNANDIMICRDSLKRYQDEKGRIIELIESKNVKEAFEKLDNSFDGAIVDLKLADAGDEGNQVIQKIINSNYRIPIAILTGTPDNRDSTFTYIGVYKKGETKYNELFDNFWDIYNTGLTRILGGRGEIQRTLDHVFQNQIIKQKDKWIEYGKADPNITEKALLRHTLNHLIQLLEEDVEECFPEEMYIYPPLTKELKTGCIIKNINSASLHMVLTPPCDLVIRPNGKMKTDRILLAEIDKNNFINEMKGIQEGKNKKELNKIKACKYFNSDSEAFRCIQKSQKEKIETLINKLFRNTHDLYHHWLPPTEFFDGGFINFRRINTINEDELKSKYDKPLIQISPSFLKDILYRFSSFYARQGQPDVDCESIIVKYSESIN